MTPKSKAKQLVKLHTLYEGDNGNFKEYYTDNLEAKRHAFVTIKQMLNIDLLNFHSDYWKKVK